MTKKTFNKSYFWQQRQRKGKIFVQIELNGDKKENPLFELFPNVGNNLAAEPLCHPTGGNSPSPNIEDKRFFIEDKRFFIEDKRFSNGKYHF